VNHASWIRLSDRRRLGSLAVGVSLWLAPTAGALPPHSPAAVPVLSQPATASAPAATSVQAAPPNSDVVPAFRLGTAARPFGWSTAIGDLNTDGTPDFVIADRTSRRTGGYTYRIQFSVSGLKPRSVSFESMRDALTVRISDVDHDNDPDVVVSAVLSREVVGVWLNDGGGRFQAADVRLFASEIRLLQSVDTSGQSADPSPSGLPSRRTADGLPVLAEATPALAGHPLLAARPHRFYPARHSGTAAPRGPPQHSA
jgi:hypothetical protein